MASPRPKYQVFISSTYEDLKDERREVTWAVLKEGHIPAGMENFPATDDRGWKIIQKTIDVSDYYVLLVAGRYGTKDQTCISWTEREYDYAVEKKVPVLAFIREDAFITKDKTDAETAKLDAFKKRLREHHAKTWTTADKLVAEVTAALRYGIQDDEDSGTMRPGWIRGDQIPSLKVMDELARLSKENADLRETAAALLMERPALTLKRRDQPVQDWTEEWKVSAGERSINCWISLVVANEGLSTADGVRVALRFNAGEYSRALSPHGVARRPFEQGKKDEARDRTRHVYLDSVVKKKSGFEVIQRIQSVSRGSEEHLIRLAIKIDISQGLRSGEPFKLPIKYFITCTNGDPVKGSFTMTGLVRVKPEPEPQPTTGTE